MEKRFRTCHICSAEFFLEDDEKNNNRCKDCREKSRHKRCRKCEREFRDDSVKNTKRYCSSCSTPERKEKLVASERTLQRRRANVKRGSGRLDDLGSLTLYTNTWWGRVGEHLFQYLYPQAQDSNVLFGNKAPFDFDGRELGKVDVKTAKEVTSKYGLSSWKFQVEGVNKICDYGFLVGLSKDKTQVIKAWRIPAKSLPDRLKVLTPDSSEYKDSEHELSSSEVGLLSRRLSWILENYTQESLPYKDPKKEDKPEYERVVLGKIGEAIYKHLYPSSDHIAERNPVETYDFKDADGTLVNVRVRRPYKEETKRKERWTFFRTKGCIAEDYFFIGMDSLGETVELFLRVPSKAISKGFSIARGSTNSKWLQYSVEQGLPKKVSDLIGVDEFNKIHLKINSFNYQALCEMSASERALIIEQAFRYHRTLGFPYPGIPSDKRLKSEISQISSYSPEGKILRRDNSGLGICSAYMPHRFESSNYDSDFTALSAFNDDQRLKIALEFSSSGKVPSLRRRSLRSALTSLNKTPVNFRPAVASALCKIYSMEGGVVFDPCAGWGGRMLGALSAGFSYTGVDPSEKTCDGLYLISERVKNVIEGKNLQVNILQGRVEDLSLEEGWADFALTSPPYWVKEVYSGVEEKFTSYAEWVANFLVPMFCQTYKVLKLHSFFAVAVSDIRIGRDFYPLVETTRESALIAGFSFKDVWRMEKSSFGKSSKGFEEVLVFGKCSS